MQAHILSNSLKEGWGGILHPTLPKECLLVPGLKLVAASPAGRTLHRGSDLTPHWLQDSALSEDWSHSTQSYALYPLGESHQDHGPDHMTVSPGTYFTREQEQLFKSWFMNLQAFCDQDWEAEVTAALASRNCDRPFSKGRAKIKKKSMKVIKPVYVEGMTAYKIKHK